MTAIAHFLAAMVAVTEFGATEESETIFVPPETREHTIPSPPGRPDLPPERVELLKWTNGNHTFHIGYSKAHDTIVLAIAKEAE